MQWPRTLTRGFDTAATIRLVIGAAFIRSLEWTLAVTRSSRPSIASVWSSDAVVEDVDLDALEQPERVAERRG